MVAGAFFILPLIFILWTLSCIYVVFGNLPWVAAIFYGLKPAVLAIVAAAVLRAGRGDDIEDAFRPTQELPARWVEGGYI